MSPKEKQNTQETVLLVDNKVSIMEVDSSDEVTSTNSNSFSIWQSPAVWSPPHRDFPSPPLAIVEAGANRFGTVIRHPFVTMKPNVTCNFGDDVHARFNLSLPLGCSDVGVLMEDPKSLEVARVIPLHQAYETVEERERARAKELFEDYSSYYENPWEALCPRRYKGKDRSPSRKKAHPRPRVLTPPEKTDPVITKDVLAMNDEFLGRPKEEQTLQYEGIKIAGGEMRVLRDDEWISDTIIDYYLKLLSERSRANPTLHPKIYCFGCYFYKMLAESDISCVEEAADDVDLFSYEYLFIPALSCLHWRLIVVDVAERTIISYNSSKGFCDTVVLKNIEEYLTKDEQRRSKKANEEARKGDGESTKEDGDGEDDGDRASDDNVPIKWKKIPRPSLVPQQGNGYDCGVFILEFADYICRKKEFNFQQENMAYFRERILYECVNKTFMD